MSFTIVKVPKNYSVGILRCDACPHHRRYTNCRTTAAVAPVATKQGWHIGRRHLCPRCAIAAGKVLPMSPAVVAEKKRKFLSVVQVGRRGWGEGE